MGRRFGVLFCLETPSFCRVVGVVCVSVRKSAVVSS